MVVYWKNLKKGEKAEDDNKMEIMEKLALNKLEKTGRFDCFDFETDRGYLEFRTRTCNSFTYPTTMIPIGKIDFSQKTEKECILVIQFKDKTLWWKIPKDYQYKAEMGGRCDRKTNEFRKKYFYLDVSEMNEL
jgi:hypothetical protein